MTRTSRVPGVAILATLVALLAGCVAVPKLRPDVEGVGDLPVQGEGGDPLALPNALVLPRLPAGHDARPLYKIGPLDQLVVTVWGRADLGSQVPVAFNGELKASAVREDGTIDLPFLEPVDVKGKTIEEIQKIVQEGYSRIVEKPQVEVKLHACSSRSVEVSGEVLTPGKFYICAERMTVGEAVGTAGSTILTADPAAGVLTRGGKAYRLDFRETKRGEGGAADIVLEDGDTIHFPRLDEKVVYVLGEVMRQGVYPMPKSGMTLIRALGSALGPDNVNYDIGGIYLIRQEINGPLVVYRLKMEEVLQSPNIQLRDGDRIFVAASGLTRWDRFWRKILPFGTVFRTSVTTIPV